MKRLLLLFAFCAVGYSYAQDTTVVQTLTYDSTGRDYVFDFNADMNLSYEKVIMAYSMRCKNALVSSGGSPNLGCGEWDYSCNTYLVDSAYTDSAKASRDSHEISNFSGTTFGYTSNPTFSYYQYDQQMVVNDSVISEVVGTVGAGSTPLNEPLTTTDEIGRTQYLWTETELTGAGLTAGNITSIRFEVTSPGAAANFLRVRMKETTQTVLDPAAPETDNFTEVYFLNTAPANGTNELIFYTPFNWNGTDNVLVDISYTNSASGANSAVTGHDAGYVAGLHSTGLDYNYNFSAVGHIDLPASNMSTVSNEITIAFWQYGDAAVLPANTTILEGVDASNRRQANVHLPWSNGQVYWDCGNDGSGYDRINKPANEVDYEGQWHHWAFTKNATSGDMRIYLDGQLWHSGTGKTRPIDLQAFRMGASITGSTDYFGKMDEFQIFDAELSQATIEGWMNLPVTASHPNYANLVAYYPLNEGVGSTTQDASPGAATGTIAGPTQWQGIRGKDIFRNFTATNERPNLDFVQGQYTQTINTVSVLDSVQNNQHSVISYQVVSGNLEIIDTMYVWQGDTYVYTYDENGVAIDSTFITGSNSITITTLDYYNKWPSAIELMSFVTPYGINLNLGAEGKTWYFDVTDFIHSLQGQKRMYLSRGGQNQEEMDIKFLFIEGTPTREVLSLQQVWPVSSQNYQNIQADNRFEPRMIETNPNGTNFKIRTMITGHGQEGEFIPRTHYVNVDGGNPEFQWDVWTECGDNPVYPQGGTWIYDRAGWCPGAATDLKEWDVTSVVTPGQPLEVDYGVNTGSGDSRYIVNHQFVTYGDPNHSVDVAMDDIIRPSSKVKYTRFNPLCAQPVVRIKNSGATTLTSCTITYGMKGAQDQAVYQWTGSLDFLQTEEITLPEFYWGWWTGEGTFEATVSNPNGTTDEYAQNDNLSSTVLTTPQHGGEFIIWLRTNLFPNETTWTLFDGSGNTVASQTNTSNWGQYENIQDTVSLANGCYRLRILDSDDDGISFWANNDGGGFVRVKGGNESWKTLATDFGRFIEYDFTVGGVLAVPTEEFTQIFEVFPNPTSGLLQVDLDFGTEANAELRITDLLGNVIMSEQLNQFRSGKRTLDMSTHSNGVYFCTIMTAEGAKTKKFILNK